MSCTLDTKKHSVVGRFAPSPTGRMHAGNVLASLVAWLVTKSQGGRMVLRIEDLDTQRSKECFSDAIQRDFEKLGLVWDEGPYFQHDREEAYEEAFKKLKDQGRLYPCFCTRADIHLASAPQKGAKQVYPGTCRNLSAAQRHAHALGCTPSQRLKVDDISISLVDQIQGYYHQNLAQECGDFLIKRRDGLFAYQLAVVVDDAAQGITSVVRGVDLLCSTPQQLFLQNLLGLPHPTYAHLPLLCNSSRRRLSKRDKDASLDMLLEQYGSPAGVIGYLAGISGLAPSCEPLMPHDLLKGFTIEKLPTVFKHPMYLLWPDAPVALSQHPAVGEGLG